MASDIWGFGGVLLALLEDCPPYDKVEKDDIYVEKIIKKKTIYDHHLSIGHTFSNDIIKTLVKRCCEYDYKNRATVQEI